MSWKRLAGACVALRSSSGLVMAAAAAPELIPAANLTPKPPPPLPPPLVAASRALTGSYIPSLRPPYVRPRSMANPVPLVRLPGPSAATMLRSTGSAPDDPPRCRSSWRRTLTTSNGLVHATAIEAAPPPPRIRSETVG